MRGMGGLALAEKIIELRPNCKIVFCTGYEEYALPAFKLHASGYLMKPISAEDVQVEIDNIKGVRQREKLLTISCFGNVMSYIRLFAVGMAGVAISQSFNGIAAGMHGPLIILGVLVVLIGHALNIIMCFLSVVVHGVRLNVLEFSGQVGLEWTGLPYEPFKTLNK